MRRLEVSIRYLLPLSTLFFRKQSLIEPGAPHLLLEWLASKPTVSASLCPHHWATTCRLSHSNVYGAGNPNSGPHLCTTSILSTEPSPYPHNMQHFWIHEFNKNTKLQKSYTIKKMLMLASIPLILGTELLDCAFSQKSIQIKSRCGDVAQWYVEVLSLTPGMNSHSN